MSLNDQTYQLIESYLNGLLSNQEKIDFEERIANEAELAQEIELFKLMEGYIGEGKWPNTEIESEHPKLKDYVKEYLKDDVKAVEAKLEKIGLESPSEHSISNSSTTSRWKVFSAAAAVLLLVGCFFFMQPSSINKYANNLEHNEILLAERNDGSQTFADAEKYFNEGEFKKAIPLLIEVNKKVNDYNVDLALGIALLEVDQIVNAREQFDKIYNSDALIKDRALWYSAMTYLKVKDNQKALDTFEKLKSEFPYYKAEEVERLINKLK